MADPLLSIGAFASQAGVPAKTLRRYADGGLVPPFRVDPDTGYRWYAPEQVDDARLVALLRRLDMPLPCIREVLDAADPSERWVRVRRFWSEQRQLVAEREQLLVRLHRHFTGETVAAEHLGSPFDRLGDDALAALRAELVPVAIPSDVPLFVQGDAPDALYLVSSGSVRVVLDRGPLGVPVVITVLGPGAVVGEAGVLDDAPRGASVYTNEQCELLRLGADAFRALADAHPEIESGLRSVLAARR